MNWLQSNYQKLISAEEIAIRVGQMGQQIAAVYGDLPLSVLVVLKGSFVFAADLIRAIDLPLKVEFIGLRSYGDRISTSGVVEITLDVKHPLQGEHVLIVEDIVDSGLTLNYLLKNLATRQPASLRLASLLHKPSRTRVEVPIDFLGFEVPDHFVVGYGLDFAGQYRNLPEIGYLDPPLSVDR